MTENLQQEFIFLDTDAERKQLLREIFQIRSDLRTFLESIPEDQVYEPTYHGWSPAAVYGHLNLMDNIGLILIKIATRGIPLPYPPRIRDTANNITAQMFRKRLVSASNEWMEQNQKHITNFIMNLPIDDYTWQVYYPPRSKRLTVEQAVQAFFLHHWRDHLLTMRERRDLTEIQ